MQLKPGDIAKHFKGADLVEKNIYQILAVNPVYTGTKEFPKEEVVVYTSLFQEDKFFIREYTDLVSELSEEEKIKYGQNYRIDLLTKEEMELIKTPEFIEKKKAYLEEKYNKKKTL